MAMSWSKKQRTLNPYKKERLLLKHEIQTIRKSLHHLDLRVSRMEKVMWTICMVAVTHLLCRSSTKFAFIHNSRYKRSI